MAESGDGRVQLQPGAAGDAATISAAAVGAGRAAATVGPVEQPAAGRTLFGLTRWPACFTQTFAGRGPGVTSPIGLAPWWVDPATSGPVLGSRLADADAMGAQFVLINRPMGTTGRAWVPGASFYTMRQHQRDATTRAVAEHPGTPIAPFVGSFIRDARVLEGWTPNTDAYPSPDDPFGVLFDPSKPHACAASWETLVGWMSVGVRTLILDSASRNWQHFASMADHLRALGIRLIGEAIPHDGHWPEPKAVTAMPWMALHQFMADRAHPERAAWKFDPDTTRVFVWLNDQTAHYGDEKARTALVTDYLRRGLVPITNDPVMFNAARDWAEKGAA